MHESVCVCVLISLEQAFLVMLSLSTFAQEFSFPVAYLWFSIMFAYCLHLKMVDLGYNL